MIPDVVTHYHRRDRPPFLTLSDLPAPELETVLRTLAEQGGSARRFGPRYMALRRATEDRAREMFVAAGGAPERRSPHYFVLGSSRWFRGLYDDPGEVVLPLSSLPTEVTSATYPDSFGAFGLGADFGLQYVPRPYHGQVYRLEQLPQLVGRYGLPPDRAPQDYAGYQRETGEHYIEVQLWSDRPLAGLLPSARPAP